MLFRLLSCVLFLVLGAASAASQQAEGGGDPAPRLDRTAWEEAFTVRLSEVGVDEKAAQDAEVIRLVAAYAWHAVPKALAWLDRTDPEKEVLDGLTRKILLVRAKVIARIMEKKEDAPGLLAITDRVANWSELEWRKYRDAHAEEKKATAHCRKHGWTEAAKVFLEVARSFQAVGRDDWAAHAIRRVGLGFSYGKKHQQARKFWRRALALQEEIGNPAAIAGLLDLLGRASNALREYDKGREYFERNLEQREKIGDPAAIAGALEHLGNFFNYDLRRYGKAREYYERALEHREKSGDPAGTANLLERLGLLLRYSLGRSEKARQCFQRALVLREKLGNPADIARSLRYLGAVYYSLRQYGKAHDCYERAIVLQEQLGNSADIAKTLTNLGITARRLKQYEKAAEYYSRALELFEKIGNTANIARTHYCLGNLFQDLGQYGKARQHHERALALREKTGNLVDTAWSLNNLGNTFKSLGEYGKARAHLERALALKEKIGKPADVAGTLVNLGSVFRSMGQYEKARKHYKRALALAEKIGNPAVLATLFRNLGNFFNSLGQYEEARKHTERSLALYEKTGDPAGIAASLTNLGSVFRSMGRLEKARECHERSFELYRKMGKPADIALVLHNLGGLCHSMGRYEESLDFHRRALALREKIGNPASIASSLDCMGVLSRSFSRYEEALAYHRRALALAEKIGNQPSIARSLGHLGVVYNRLGRYEEAIGFLRRDLALREEIGNKDDIASSLNELGNVFESLGRHEKALAYHRRALAFLETIGNKGKIATSLKNLGCVFHSLGRNEEALDYHRRALAIEEEVGHQDKVAMSFTNLAAVHISLGRDEEAFDYLRRALALFEKTGNEDDMASSLNNLGIVTNSLGRHEEALAYHRRALRLREKIDNQAEIAGSLSNTGSTLRRLGRVREAREHFARALDKVSTARQRLVADPDRVAFMDRWHDVIVPALEAALTEKAPEIVLDGQLALRAVETLRGMATADLFQASLRGVRLPGSGPLVAEVERLEAELDICERTVRGTFETAGTARIRGQRKARRKELRAEQRELEKKWQDAVDQLRRSSPEWANLKRPRTIGLDELRALLPKETAYLAYALGEEVSFLLVVDRGGLRHWRLPGEATIEIAVNHHLELLATGPGNGAELGRVIESGRNLYSLLLAPAEEELRRYGTLLVSAEGCLWGVPFETLVVGGEGTDLRVAPYLLHRHAVAYVHSATVWGINWKRCEERCQEYGAGRSVRPTGTLVLADPLLPGEAGWKGKTLHLIYAAKRSEPVGRLPFSRVEGFSVAAGLERLDVGRWRLTVDGKRKEPAGFLAQLEALREPGAARDVVLKGPGLELRVGQAASRTALTRRNLEGVRFLHLATHAHLDAECPGLSGMWLSPVDTDDSGFLRLADVMSLGLRAELVTLSGCETGLGKTTMSEGYQGLVRTFLFTGAENVLASAWRVDDKASAELLTGLYRMVRAGEASVAAAVRDVKRDYLGRVPASTPEKAHPYYWGAWMLWGTGVKVK